MILVLSGPMTGFRDYNYPAFNDAARELRDMGHLVYSPTEYDFGNAINWSSFVGVCLGVMDDLEKKRISPTLVHLPGWQSSGGAIVETAYAEFLGWHIIGLEDLIYE